MRLPPGLQAGASNLDIGLLLSDATPLFSYAFQPIVDVAQRRVHSFEALIRGPADEPAFSVLQRVPPPCTHTFDRDSRMAAIALAARLHLPCQLNLNFLPQGLLTASDAISSVFESAARHGIAIDRVMLEVTEGEVITDHARFAEQLNRYRSKGLRVAIDDFGAGYSGLNLLADFQPDQVKIDMNLVRGIERHGPRQAIVRAIVQVCEELGIDVVVEGVETLPEYRWFLDHGIRLFQGYLFARPGFECFPAVAYPGPD